MAGNVAIHVVNAALPFDFLGSHMQILAPPGRANDRRTMPDILLRRNTDDPASIVAAQAGIRLAFVAAIQHLSALQRAALILARRTSLAGVGRCHDATMPRCHDATMLDMTTAAVNGALNTPAAVYANSGWSRTG
jgi:hypothetical protein